MKHIYASIKKIILVLPVVLFFSTAGYTQVAEREPNNSFETADTINRLSVKTGSVNNINNADPLDYFMAIFPSDGTLKIYVNGTNNHNTNGYLYMRGFDRRKGSGQVYEKYISNNSNIGPGAGISDVITVHGRAADTFYFRFETSGIFSYGLSYDIIDLSENDTEPNGTFEEAILINQMEEKNGHIKYAKNGGHDDLDYYRTLLSIDGTLKIYVKATNQTGGNSYLYLRGYDRRKGNGQIFEKYISNSSNIPAGTTVYDTLTLHGRASDSFYFRYEAAGAFNYSFKYDIIDTSENDAEPNDVFETAIAMSSTDEKKGHIKYAKNGGHDDLDYYRTVLPVDGTLKIYVEGTNTGGGNGYMYLRGYDKRKSNGQVFETYISGNSNIPRGTTVTDSIIIYGVLADTFYFRFEASGPFKYKIRYTVIQNSELDDEPNNNFEQALSLRQGVIKVGQVGYTSGGVRDDYDYYKTLLPTDGTMKVYVKGTNNSGGNGYLYLRGYDGRKGNGQVFEKYISNNSNIPAGATIYDTITLYGRASDSFYFRFEGAGAWSYNISYAFVDTSENDTEPNGTFAEAIPINQWEEKKGHIKYAKNGGHDELDYYKTLLVNDGTLKIYVKATNQGGGNSYMYLRGYDRRKGNGQIFEKYVANSSTIPAGATIYDTITLHGRASDSFYFRFEGAGAFNYSFKYDSIDTSENDAEPNDVFETAIAMTSTDEKKGHIKYAKNGGYDDLDYYKTVLPQDGTLKIYVKATNQNGGNGYMYLRGYDRRKGNGQIFEKYISNSSNIPPGATIFDTITIHSRGADSFYFRLEAAGAFNYSIKYALIDTSENDSEPNGTFEEAIQINQLEEKKGHIKYAKNGGHDELDYYKTLLVNDGTLKIYVKATNQSGGNSYLYMRGYDRRKGNGQIFEKYISNNSNIPHGTTLFDTITVTCRAADTFYFRLEGAGAFNYTLSYDLVNISPNDAEPNNTFETSIPAIIDTTYRGHIGYVNNGGQDNHDYYKSVLTAKGTVKIIVEATNTSGGNGYVYLRGYDNRKGNGQIFEKYVSNNSNVPVGATIRDTISLNCVSTDTLYLRWESAGCFKYTFKYEYIDRQPRANMEYERLGNTVGFRPQLSNATSFLWSFGDGTTSTVKYPMKTYTPGFYTARLIVTNSVCNFKDTAQQNFEIKGVEYYTPDSSGNGGDAIMKIFGGGLDTATKVTLTKGGITLTPVRKFNNAVKNQLNAIFDLHHAEEGIYTVTITVPGLAPLVYPNGFRIAGFRYPYTWSEVVAPFRWRTNVDTRIKLVVGNKGNVNASGVLVALVWPKTLDLKFDTKWFKPPAAGNYTISTKDTTMNFKWEDIQHFYKDSVNKITAIDTFAGKPYNGYIRLILIPKIAGGSTYEIPLIARSTQTAEQNFITFTYKPNLFGSCPDGSWMDMSENLAVESVDLLDKAVSAVPVLDKSPVKWLVTATKGTTQHMANLGQAMGAFYNYLDGTTNSIDESLPADYYQNVDAGNAQVAKAVLDVAVDKMVEKGADNLMKGQTDRLNDYIAKNPNASQKSFDFAIDNLNTTNDVRNLIKDMYKTGKDLKDLKEKLERLKQLVDDCPDLKKQLDDLTKEIDKDMNQKDPKETKTNSLNSFDPNAIYGPVGQGVNQYVNRNDRQHFLVTFENVDTATAAAQIVKVIDTLDKSKFDLSTFEFGNVTVGTKNFEVPKGRHQFVMEQSLNPGMNVRINAELDTAKGIVTWQFTAIDPATKDIPVFEGFLPPNKNKPEGEGSGSYTVYPLKSVPDGTVFSNRASIIFDFNAPIFTNTWQNIADVPPPVSTVAATAAAGDSIIHLSFSGKDEKSGVGYYNLYVSENGGSWQAFSGSATGTLSMKGEPGKTYGFYTNSQDKVGNMENKTPGAETIVTLSYCSTSGPAITASGATTFCQGGSVTLSTTATGSLQWLKDGVAISGATGQSYTATQSGSYALRATVNSCTTTSSLIVVTVTAGAVTPTITTSGATTFCQGGSVILSTTSTASLQWLKDGVAISGATGQSYTVMQSGSYTVRAGEGTCTAISAPIVVTVNTLPATPTITTSGATTFCQGGSVVLSTTASGTLQWFRDGVAISGSTAQSYTATQSGSYTVRTEVGTCMATSAAIVVTVTATATTPTITASGATTFCQGGSVILSTLSTATLQWFKDGTSISGATGQSYTVTQSGSYTVTAGDGACTATSSAIAISVIPVPSTPTITASGATTFCQGGNVILSTTSSGTLQWLKDGTLIPAATGQSYTVTQSGSYTVRAGDGICTAISGATIITVTPVPSAPTISASGATTFCQGSNVILSTTSTGTLQWLRDGTAISGATGQTYTSTQSGSYTLRLGTASCTVTSSAIVVTVTSVTTPTVTASGATTFCQGGNVTLNSSSPVGNQWYRDGISITGAVNQAFISNQSGNYTVIITTNNCVSAASSPIGIVVNAIPAKPVITVNGNTLSSSHAGINQWYLNGNVIPGATTQQYNPVVTGQYTVQAIQTGCTSPLSDVFNFNYIQSVDLFTLYYDVLVYPNPVKDKLTINNKSGRKLSVRIVNMQGVILSAISITSTTGIIDMNFLNPGTYIIDITDISTNQVMSKTIIKN